MSRCPNCDTPLHITRAASPVIESDSAHDYRMNAINSTPPKSSEPEKAEPALEKDMFGRPIIERLGGAFIVKCGDDGLLQISRNDGWWYSRNESRWTEESNPAIGLTINMSEARDRLRIAAASLELPTANPAASAKPYTFNGPIPSSPSAAEFSDLRLRVGDLEREVAALKAVK